MTLVDRIADLLRAYTIVKRDDWDIIHAALGAATELAQHHEDMFQVTFRSLQECAVQRNASAAENAALKTTLAGALDDVRVHREAENASAAIVRTLQATVDGLKSDNARLQAMLSDINVTAAHAAGEVARLKGLIPPVLEPPTEVFDYPASTIAGVLKRDLGIDVHMLDGNGEVFRVVRESDFIFKFAHKVQIRPYVRGLNDCENQTREFTQKCHEWGSNNVVLEGQGPTEWHRWAAAVVQTDNGELVTVEIDPFRGERVSVGYKAVWGEAYG